LGPTAIKTRCPQCGTALKTDYEQVGATVRCPACRNTFVVTTVEFVQGGVSGTIAAAVETRGDAGTSVADRATPGRSSRQAAAQGPQEKLGRFVIQGVLGRGAFGVVYRARDPLLDRDVALKAPRFPSGDQKNAQRFLAEAKAAAKLRHPHIVAVYESGETEGKLFIASEYVAGETLAARIEKQGPDFKQTAQWVRSLAEALAYAHAQGIVHRDIKPQNVMLDRNNRPQIMDFGLAKRLDQNSTATAEGSLLGTPAYMAPEQARGEVDKVGPHSDQYSLGTVLYELLTGRRPFEGPAAVVIARAASEEPPAPRSINPEIPPDLEAICLKAMERDLAKRYANTANLAADLERWLNGEPVTARPLSMTVKLRRWARRRPLVAGLTTAVAVLLIVAAGGGVIGWGMMVHLKNDVASALKQVEDQSTLTAKETENALAATRAAQERTEAASAQAQLAGARRKAMEEAAVELQEIVDQKTEVEDQVAATIKERKDEDERAGRAAAQRTSAEAAAGTAESAAADSARNLYVELLGRAKESLERGDRQDAARLLDECPEQERRWEWRYLKAMSRAIRPTDQSWILYSLNKGPRSRSVPTSDGYMGSLTSIDGKIIPTGADDPDWANVPPANIKSIRVAGQPHAIASVGLGPKIEAVAASGTALIVSYDPAAVGAALGVEIAAERGAGMTVPAMPKRRQLFVQIWDIAENGTAKVVNATAAPMLQMARSRTSRSKNDAPTVGFAFSRDGSELVQLSTNPDYFKPSPLRILTLKTDAWREWRPANAGAQDFAAAAKATPGKVDGLLDFYNEHTSDKALQLVPGSQIAVSPDGSRIARVDENGLNIRLLDRATSKVIASLPTGLDFKRFFADRDIDLAVYEPKYEVAPGSTTFWSVDGKRLLVNVKVAGTYIWGRDGRITYVVDFVPVQSVQSRGIQTNASGQGAYNDSSMDVSTTYRPVSRAEPAPGPHQITPIHFDCIIVLSAE
jgi:hypothetical protein